MSPYEHGECYVLDDGAEVDLDLGNYERFLGVSLCGEHNVTSGKVYQQVIGGEREGVYLGKTVQMVPHVTDAVQRWILKVASRPVDDSRMPPDVCLIEVGGTVGDIESAVYLEAIQQLSRKVGLQNFCLAHVSYVPFIGEQKTKPTQHGVKELRGAGLAPDFLFCRSEQPLTEAAKQKISLFAQVQPEHVFSVHNCENIYKVPLLLEDQELSTRLIQRLGLDSKELQSRSSSAVSLGGWRMMAERLLMASPGSPKSVCIGIVGKYTGLTDSYLSVLKALEHAAMEAGLGLALKWIESSSLEDEKGEGYADAWKALKSVDGVVCPGGFGDRGIWGKALSAQHCRETAKPYLGICLGMQTAVIEIARSLLGLREADSEEFNPNTPHPVVVSMPEHTTGNKGSSMRLGKRATIIRDKHSLTARLYGGEPVVDERHRHRYEVNPQYVQQIEAKGLKFVGQDERGQRMEIAELQDHPFFICTQFHPEFTSRPLRPSPVFLGLILAAAGTLQDRLKQNGGFLRPGSAYAEHMHS
ncbi:CTP synthase [Cyclospora cayetanensis]|nr:CTP synthase [Cyclospora cayetanensis]